MNKILAVLVLALVLGANSLAVADDLNASTKGDIYNKSTRKELPAPKPDDDAAEVQQVIVEQTQKNNAKPITEIAPGQSVDTKTEPTKAEPVAIVKEPAIISQALPEVGADSTGIAEGQLNLGSNLWQNTSYGTALRLIQGLVPYTNSAVIQDLRTRVLMTAAEPPRKNAAKPDNNTQSLVEHRLQKLWSNGDLANYAALANLLPTSMQKSDIGKTMAMAQWVNGDEMGGCDRAERAAVGTDSDNAKIKIYCAIARGQNDAANLTFDLWREKNAASDPAFVTMVDVLIHDAKRTAINGKSMSVIDWLMAKKSGVQVAVAASDIHYTPSMIVATQTKGMEWSTRAELIEKLAIGGVIAPAMLTAIYDEYPAKPDDASLLNGKKSKLSSAQRRAIIWQHGKSMEDIAAHATMINDMLAAISPGSDDYQLLSIVAAAWMANVTPSTDLLWFAPNAVRMAIAAGQFSLAKSWMDIAMADDTAAAKTWPYLRAMRLIDTASPRGKSLMEKWAAYSIVDNPKALEFKLGLAAMLIRAAGDNDDLFNRNLMPGGFSAEMLKLSDKKSASPALSLALSQAMQNFSRGEGILLCDYVLSSAPLSAIASQNAAQCIEALAKFGLQPESRYLAMEIFAAQGL